MNRNTLNFGIFVLGMIWVLFSTSCERVNGYGELTEHTLHIEPFEGVELNISGNIVYSQSSDYSLVIEAQENIFDLLTFTLPSSSKVLKIDTRRGVNLGAHKPIVVYVSSPEIHHLETNGSGNITGADSLVIKNLSVKINGSGNIQLYDLNVTDLYTTITGSGDAKYSGVADFHRMVINGSGSIRAFDFLTKNSEIHINGSGNCFVTADDHLDININGSGSVFYKGLPHISISKTGSGTVEDRN